MHGVEIHRGRLTDPARDDQAVPYLVYAASTKSASLPVVLFSHDLGGTRAAMIYLASHLAHNGYAVVTVRHHGTDRAVFAGKTRGRCQAMAALRVSLRDTQNAINRFLDIHSWSMN